MRGVLLSLVLAITPLAAASPFAVLSGEFLLPGATGAGASGMCDVPGWDGLLGSCAQLPAGAGGHGWSLATSGVVPPLGYWICFDGQGGLACQAGPGQEGTSTRPLAEGHERVMVTTNGGARIAWTLTIG